MPPRRFAAGSEDLVLLLVSKDFAPRAAESRSSRPDISGVNNISAPPAAASAIACSRRAAFAAGSIPVVDWKRAILVISNQIVETAAAFQIEQVVAAADMVLPDEDLRDRGPAVRALDHLLPSSPP